MYASPDSYVLTPGNYTVGHEDWFPMNPECPNHKAGVPFSSAFADPNSSGQVSCAECFLHSTIVQSMNLSCGHLHACSNCANCYSHKVDLSQNPATAGPSPHPVSNRGSPEIDRSPPIFQHPSPQMSLPQFDTSSSTLTHNSSALFHPNARQRRPSLMAERHALYTAPPSFSHSYSNPSSRTQTPVAEEQPKLLQVPTQQIHSYNLTILKESTQNMSKSPSHNIELAEQAPPITVPSHANNLSSDCSVVKSSSPITQKHPKRTKIDLPANRKRGANDVCEVCGDRASGYHYNALTCEGCKGFFRRSINRKEPLDSCKYGGACEMDTYTRRKCPECRLKKCRAVGMLEECLLTEIQCRSKRRNKGTRKNKETNDSSFSSRSASVTPKVEPQSSNNKKENIAQVTDSMKSDRNRSRISELGITADEESINELISSAFVEYATNPMLVKGWTTYLKGKTDPPKLCDLATAHVKVLVQFTKKLPVFSRLNAEDQIGLLKGSVVEIGLLRNCYSYNRKSGEVDLSVFAHDAGLHEAHFRCVLDFFSKVQKLGLDSVEYGLLSCIILFDCDHAYTDDTARIDKCRDAYISILKNYSESRKPKRTQIVAKILNLITELRTLYNTHAQMVSTVRKRGELSELLCEVWDIK